MPFSTNDFRGLSAEAFRATTLDCYLLMDEDTKTWKDEAVYDLSLRGSHCKPLCLGCGSISKAAEILREEVLLEKMSHYGQVWVQPKPLPAFCHVKKQPPCAPVTINRAVSTAMPR